VLPPVLVLKEVPAPALGALENDLVAGQLALAIARGYPLSAISYLLLLSAGHPLRIADSG
jgi:hypothetical protein